MNISQELDRIQQKGFNVLLSWQESITISRIGDSFTTTFKATSYRKDSEKWKHCLCRAIFEFDELFPD